MRTLLVPAALALAACVQDAKLTDTDTDSPVEVDADTDADADSDADADADTDSLLCEIEVPPPGNFPSPANWVSDNTNVHPSLAWPVGIVPDRAASPAYPQTVIPPGEDSAYFVFGAGSSFNIDVTISNSTNPIEHVHVHAAPDLCFGGEIEPIHEDVQPDYHHADFPVVQGGVYVVEVRIPGGGFF